MIVITMTNCPSKLRGDLTKWLCEINTGVYVGQVNAKVREALWHRVCQNIGSGQATMVYSFANEQHLEFRTHNAAWKVRDFDGIKLMMRPNAPGQDGGELPKGFSNASKRRIAAKRRSGFANINEEWVFMDIETTGLDPETDAIIEIAAIVADKTQIKTTQSTLIKTEKALPPPITALTGITDGMLCSEGMKPTDALKLFHELIKGKTMVCYNRNFDIVFLENEFQKVGLESPFGKVIDILPLARKRISAMENYKLKSLADFFGISYQPHRALPDCEALYQVFLKLNEI